MYVYIYPIIPTLKEKDKISNLYVYPYSIYIYSSTSLNMNAYETMKNEFESTSNSIAAMLNYKSIKN